jgi:uncharacterized membrane protein
MSTSEKTTAKRNWTKPILIVSLGLNFLIIGMFTSAIMFGASKGGPGGDRADVGGLRPFVSALSHDQRRQMAKEFRKERPNFTKEHRANQAALSLVLDKITAQPFDATNLETAFSDLRNTPNRSAAKGHGMLIKAIENMTDAEREIYAVRIQENISNIQERISKPRRK